MPNVQPVFVPFISGAHIPSWEHTNVDLGTCIQEWSLLGRGIGAGIEKTCQFSNFPRRMALKHKSRPMMVGASSTKVDLMGKHWLVAGNVFFFT